MASSTSTVAWLSVMVKCSLTVVKERTILKCSWDDSFGFLLLKFGCDDLEAETIHEVLNLWRSFYANIHAILEL